MFPGSLCLPTTCFMKTNFIVMLSEISVKFCLSVKYADIKMIVKITHVTVCNWTVNLWRIPQNEITGVLKYTNVRHAKLEIKI